MAVWTMTSKEGLLIYDISMKITVVTRRIMPGILTDVLALLLEHAGQALTNLALGNLDIILGVTVILQEGEETIVGDIQLKKVHS